MSLLWFLDQSSRHSGWDSPLTIDGSSSAPGRCDYSGGKGTRQTWLCQTDPTHPREAELWEVTRSRQRSWLAQKKELDKTRIFTLLNTLDGYVVPISRCCKIQVLKPRYSAACTAKGTPDCPSGKVSTAESFPGDRGYFSVLQRMKIRAGAAPPLLQHLMRRTCSQKMTSLRNRLFLKFYSSVKNLPGVWNSV